MKLIRSCHDVTIAMTAKPLMNIQFCDWRRSRFFRYSFIVRAGTSAFVRRLPVTGSETSQCVTHTPTTVTTKSLLSPNAIYNAVAAYLKLSSHLTCILNRMLNFK